MKEEYERMAFTVNCHGSAPACYDEQVSGAERKQESKSYRRHV